MKKHMALLAVGAVVLATAACGSDSDGGGSGEGSAYRVVFSGAVNDSGPLGDTAKTALAAAKAGVVDINKKGGVDGHQVEMQVVDDKGDPTEALTKLREVLAKDKPDLYLASGPSTVSAAVLPVITQSKVLSFNIAPTADSTDPTKFPYNFDLAPNLVSLAQGPVAWAKENGYGSVGIIHSSSPGGELYASTWPDLFEADGIKVTANEEYDVAALDMTPQLEKVKATNPDALVIDGYGAPVGYVLQGLQKIGWDVPMIGNGSVASTSLMVTEKPEGLVGTPDVKNLAVTVIASAQRNDSATRVNDAVAQMASQGELKSSLMTAFHYDALFLAAAAAESAGSTDPAEMAKALEDSTVTEGADTAVIPHYAYTAESHGFDVETEALAFVAPSVMTNGQFAASE